MTWKNPKNHAVTRLYRCNKLLDYFFSCREDNFIYKKITVLEQYPPSSPNLIPNIYIYIYFENNIKMISKK